jgi:hypothetical protein
MLDELTRLTQSPDFLRSGLLVVQEVRCQPCVSPDLVLRLKLVLELPPNYDDPPQEWEVRCCRPMGGNLNHFLHGTLLPYVQLRVLGRHPVLFDYDSRSTVQLHGTCPNVYALLGALYVAHGHACGHWVAFHELFGDLPTLLAEGPLVTLEIPSGLLAVYGPVFAAHGLTYDVTHELRSRYADGPRHRDLVAGHVLLFSNPLVSDDDHNAGQPYQVAEAFREARIR